MTQLFLQRLPTNAQLILASSKDTLDTESLANSAKIATYGTRSLTLNLGLRRSFPWLFTLADVNHAIIGADFLRHFNLLVDLRLRNRSLIDAVTHLHINGITSPLPALSTLHCHQHLLQKFFKSIPISLGPPPSRLQLNTTLPTTLSPVAHHVLLDPVAFHQNASKSPRMNFNTCWTGIGPW